MVERIAVADVIADSCLSVVILMDMMLEHPFLHQQLHRLLAELSTSRSHRLQMIILLQSPVDELNHWPPDATTPVSVVRERRVGARYRRHCVSARQAGGGAHRAEAGHKLVTGVVCVLVTRVCAARLVVLSLIVPPQIKRGHSWIVCKGRRPTVAFQANKRVIELIPRFVCRQKIVSVFRRVEEVQGEKGGVDILFELC